VIVRISTENQYVVSEATVDQLNELDNQAVAAVEEGDAARFQELFEQMLRLVREKGELLDDDSLETSDVILPPPDVTFEEASTGFTGEGLIPD